MCSKCEQQLEELTGQPLTDEQKAHIPRAVLVGQIASAAIRAIQAIQISIRTEAFSNPSSTAHQESARVVCHNAMALAGIALDLLAEAREIRGSAGFGDGPREDERQLSATLMREVAQDVVPDSVNTVSVQPGTSPAETMARALMGRLATELGIPVEQVAAGLGVPPELMRGENGSGTDEDPDPDPLMQALKSLR